MKTLKRYWFTFEKFSKPTPLNLGCGVTAHNYEDAVTLLRERVFRGKELPPIAKFVEDIDVSILEQKHVFPNIGMVNVRGIWFPQGYEETR
jgi:hypothetical protein